MTWRSRRGHLPHISLVSEIRLISPHKFAGLSLKRKQSEHFAHPRLHPGQAPVRRTRAGEITGFMGKHCENAANPSNRKSLAFIVRKDARLLLMRKSAVRLQHFRPNAAARCFGNGNVY
jgi:hypothetical protein